MTTFISTFRPSTGFSFVVQDIEVALLFPHGRYIRTLAAGKHRLWTSGHEVKRIDHRGQTLQVQGQELLTADQVVLKVKWAPTWATPSCWA